MEGVPRIPMMGFPMKRNAETPHFRSRLKSVISNHYNEEPDSYNNEIHELETLRASAVHVSKDYSGCSILKKYFCQLNFLKSRFPLNEGGSCAVSFSWYDVFSEHVHGWSDVDFEMSCILYNIGALHSELGALDNRQTADGMKTSCTHFQCAAWAFSHLRHNYQKFFTPDVSPDMLNILYNICLAQAQECIFEKTLIDNRRSTITARVALQIVEYYSTALRIIDTMLKDATQYSDKLIKSVKTWRKLVELKVHYYGCITYLYRGMQAEDENKWGERVTLFKAAAEKLNTCITLGKNFEKTDSVHDTVNFTLDVVGGKVAIAEKENEFIYHEKVPELEAIMSDVKGVSLVKGIQFKFDDPQVAGPDIFGRLVPMEAHEASSLYSEEKAKILRTYSKKIEEKNESLDKFVLPLQLDQLELHDSDKVPQELIDCCAALSVNQDAVKRLSEMMTNLSGLFHDVEANLEEIHDHLQDQEKKEKEYQEVVGKRPPNNIMNEMNREFQKYQSAQAVAAESNKTLHEAMVAHVANLSILMKPLDEVMKHIPKYDEMEKNEEALQRMKKLSEKVDEMRKQRETLERQLRDSILNDDITKSLVVKKDEDLETVFKEELQKHDKVTQLLDQNLIAQENIVRALTEANAEYAETRRATVELKKKRDAVIQSMISSYEAYDELMSKCNKGIEFYKKLNTNVEKLSQRLRSVCKVQNEEREINMERIIRKAHAPSQHPPSSMLTPGGPVAPSTVSTAGVYNNMMSSSYSGGYPSSMVPSPPVGPGGCTSVGGISSLPTAGVPPRSSGGGGHLKLKDYLAMKKESQNTAAVMQNLAANSQQPPTTPANQYQVSNLDSHQQQLHPMVSSTPPPVNVPPNDMGVRPTPVGSEDVGKDSSACHYSHPPTSQQHPPMYNNYGYYSITSPTQVGDGFRKNHATGNRGGGHYNEQQQYFNNPNHVSQQQPSPLSTDFFPQHQVVQSQQTQFQNPVAPPQPQLQSYSIPVSVPPVSNQHPIVLSSYMPPQKQQKHNDQIEMPSANSSITASAYIPNQAAYNPAASMNTSRYSQPVYSSRHYDPAGQPAEMGNTFSSGYGIPLSYSGPSGYQQTVNTPAPTSTPPVQYPSPQPTPSVAPSSSSQQNSAATPSQPTMNAPQLQTPASYYSPVYHPTANTITNATYSTGTTATPTQVPSPLSKQPPVPSASTPVASQQQPPQQTPSLGVSSQSMDAYSPANSFLAQYVRQNQGYISSSSAAKPPLSSAETVFPGSISSGYLPQQSIDYQQQSQQPAAQHVTGYGQQQTNQQHQYSCYPSQQHWHQQPQPTQPMPQQHQQQASGYQASYEQGQQPNNVYPNPQYQKFEGNATPLPQQGYYNSTVAHLPQNSQNNAFHQPHLPTTQQPHIQNKTVGNSNVDLLSDIDLNAVAISMPLLAPIPVNSTENNQVKTTN